MEVLGASERMVNKLKKNVLRPLLVALAFQCVSMTAHGQSPVDLLVTENGAPIHSPADWKEVRKRHFQTATKFIYGSMPPAPDRFTTKVLSTREIMGGKATETLLVMLINHGKQQVAVRVGVVRPNTDRPTPVIIKNDRWLFDLSAMPAGRKKDQYASQHREDIFAAVRELAIDRGYAICKFIREDLAVDVENSHQTGVLAMYPDYGWGAIAAWAWGYHPIIDMLERDFHIDSNRIIATGHSRGGKVALAATIFDSRIAIAAPSASGSGGTGSFQHFTQGGRQQTPQRIHDAHPHWFSQQVSNLDVTKTLPVDGHMLLALVAPRGVINTQGRDDPLANPVGSRMMFDAASPVFDLLGAKLRPATHWRAGGHGQTLEDWTAVLDYASSYFAEEPLPSGFTLPSGFNSWPSSPR